MTMSRKFEIRSGRRSITVLNSTSPLQAALDYASRFGSASEITTIGVDSVAWRGARFVAVPVADEPERTH